MSLMSASLTHMQLRMAPQPDCTAMCAGSSSKPCTCVRFHNQLVLIVQHPSEQMPKWSWWVVSLQSELMLHAGGPAVLPPAFS